MNHQSELSSYPEFTHDKRVPTQTLYGSKKSTISETPRIHAQRQQLSETFVQKKLIFHSTDEEDV